MIDYGIFFVSVQLSGVWIIVSNDAKMLFIFVIRKENSLIQIGNWLNLIAFV